MEAADLSNANFRGANLTESYLVLAKIDGAIFDETTFARALHDQTGTNIKQHRILLDSTSTQHPDVEDGIDERFWLAIQSIYKQMISYVRRQAIVDPAYDEQDIVSDVILRLIRPEIKLRFIEMDYQHRIAYIFTALRHSIINHGRVVSKRLNFSMTDIELRDDEEDNTDVQDTGEDGYNNPEIDTLTKFYFENLSVQSDPLESVMLRDLIDKELREFSSAAQTVFKLWLEGYSINEISELTNMRASSCYRIRNKVHEQILNLYGR